MKLAGVTVAELAARNGLTLAEARALVGRLELVDRDVVYAIGLETPPPA